MPKLKTLKPLIGKLPSRFPTYQPGNEQARDRYRHQAQPWRKWYASARWTKLRNSIRVRDLYTCQLCGRLCAGKGQSAVDHKIPHRGEEALFWDEGNLQLLCSPCHDSVKQAEDRRYGL